MSTSEILSQVSGENSTDVKPIVRFSEALTGCACIAQVNELSCNMITIEILPLLMAILADEGSFRFESAVSMLQVSRKEKGSAHSRLNADVGWLFSWSASQLLCSLGFDSSAWD